MLDAGADAFLLKPFPLRDLLDKVRSLLERDAPDGTGACERGHSPTRPIFAAPHPASGAAVPRQRGRPLAPAPPTPPAAGPARGRPPAPVYLPRAPRRHEVLPRRPAPRRRPPSVRHTELETPGGLDFGRFTRVETDGRSFVVLTEAVAQPRFTVTTVITEKNAPLRKIETALPHPLAREEDRGDGEAPAGPAARRRAAAAGSLRARPGPRRVVWSDQSRSVDAVLLAWAMSAVAQAAEVEAGTDETYRLFRLTLERTATEEDSLRHFHVTPEGRVVVAPDRPGGGPRAARCGPSRPGASRSRPQPSRRTRRRSRSPSGRPRKRHSVELERLGFYDRLRRRMRA